MLTVGVQVNEFKSYGIRAVVINEDTPNDSGLWKVCMMSYCIISLYNEYSVDYHYRKRC